MSSSKTGLLVAAAAAGLLLSGCASHGPMQMSSTDGSVHCSGVNSCKGKTSCKSASNDCKGKNSCKGQGWLGMSKAECDEKGGKVI